MLLSIKKIESSPELALFLPVIKISFNTVAVQFGLTELNSPSNPAFTDMKRLNELAGKSECFGLYEETYPAGFFALEQSPDKKTLYLERVCVLPDKRHNGYGAKIIQYAAEQSRNLDAEKMSIGIMNENITLKKWYVDNGFNAVSIKKFEQIPFDVCFLEYHLK